MTLRSGPISSPRSGLLLLRSLKLKSHFASNEFDDPVRGKPRRSGRGRIARTAAPSYNGVAADNQGSLRQGMPEVTPVEPEAVAVRPHHGHVHKEAPEPALARAGRWLWGRAARCVLGVSSRGVGCRGDPPEPGRRGLAGCEAAARPRGVDEARTCECGKLACCCWGRWWSAPAGAGRAAKGSSLRRCPEPTGKSRWRRA